MNKQPEVLNNEVNTNPAEWLSVFAGGLVGADAVTAIVGYAFHRTFLDKYDWTTIRVMPANYEFWLTLGIVIGSATGLGIFKLVTHQSKTSNF